MLKLSENVKQSSLDTREAANGFHKPPWSWFARVQRAGFVWETESVLGLQLHKRQTHTNHPPLPLDVAGMVSTDPARFSLE